MRKDAFRDFVLEQLGDLRGLNCVAVFSGYGLWCDKTYFGVISKGRLYFHVNDETRAPYAAAGSLPLRTGGGRIMREYLEVPANILKNPDDAVAWAEQAIEVAQEKKEGRWRKIRHR